MAPTGKVSTIGRMKALEGDGTVGSGKGHPQRLHSQGDIEPLYQTGLGQVKHVAVAEYDFDKDGALAVGNNGSGVWVPANALVTHTFAQVLTPTVGPTNMGVSLEADNDVVADASLATVFGQAAGVITTGAVTPVTEAGFLRTTVAREILFKATVAVSSAGKFVVFVEYIMSTVAN